MMTSSLIYAVISYFQHMNKKIAQKMMKIVNIEDGKFRVFWRTRGISMKFWWKMWLTIILKATEKQGFTLSLKIYFRKTTVTLTLPVLHSFTKSQENSNSYKTTKKLNFEAIIRYRLRFSKTEGFCVLHCFSKMTFSGTVNYSP